MVLGAVNLRARSRASWPRGNGRSSGEAAARLLRRTVSGETVFSSAAVFAAAALSSFRAARRALAQPGVSPRDRRPGPVAAVVHQAGYTLQVLVTPNTAAAPNSFALKLTKGGQPVTGADVTLTFAMLDMQMAQPGIPARRDPTRHLHPRAPALVMVGRWALLYSVTPKRGHAFTALLVDHAGG